MIGPDQFLAMILGRRKIKGSRQSISLDARLKGSPLRVWINPATFKPASRESLAVVAPAIVGCFGVEPLNNHLFIIDI